LRAALTCYELGKQRLEELGLRGSLRRGDICARRWLRRPALVRGAHGSALSSELRDRSVNGCHL
jgi:hypothetical protein